MRNHIAFKFLAVSLAALSLFTALASGIGIFVFTAAGLYEESVEELYEENMEATRRHFAVNLAHRYASLKLGNIPEEYLNRYYGTEWMYDNFQYGLYYYEISDEKGNIVESTTDDMPFGATRYSIQVTEINYRKRVEVLPWENSTYGDTIAILEKPTEAPAATGVSGNTEAPAATEAPAITEVPAATEAPAETSVTSEPTTAATELPAATEAPAATHPPVTSAPALAADNTIATEYMPSIPMAAAEGRAFWDEVYFDDYYSYEQGETVQIAYTVLELPPYTVDLYLLPGAMPVEHFWSLLRVVWNYRLDLFYILGISLLVFAICAVYLCCAAGRKPGREEIKAGGFNCIPLDLYLLGGGFLIALVVVYGYEVMEYLLRESPKVLAPFLAISGYSICLIFVSFCFACAAQFKTPGYYWLKNSLTGRCLQLCGKLWHLALRACGWLWRHIPNVLHWCWRKFLALTLWLWNVTKKLLAICRSILLFCWKILKNCFRFIGQKLVRMYGMLPLTWQWLLTGLTLIAIFLISLEIGSLVLLWLDIFLTVIVLLYSSHAFGILLDSTKHMAKGDLETQVSDQFLLGSFKDFAKELNALANVAVVAAQKQLKSERMKTELITNVSHDIKTPLTSIINYVDLLQKPHSEEEQEIYLEVLSRQSGQLKKLIEDLMEMSKASTGNMNVDITSVNAGEAINQALGEFSDKLEKAQLIPVFRQPENPVYMLADGRLAWRVMSNLLSNVVKYALPGTRVYVDLMELEGKVIISFKNISREELNVSADELLERFVRGDASRNTEGSGLGLNIAQSLMEIQKGQLQLLVDGDLFKVTLVFPGAAI